MSHKLHAYYRRVMMLCVAAVSLFSFTFAQDSKPAPAERKDVAPANEIDVVKRVNAATDRALDYLESKQIKEGAQAGAWRADNNAMNAMAILAFLSRGHVPGRGKYGDTIEGNAVKPGVLTRAKKFLIATQSKDKATEGYLGVGGVMYAHGMATLSLAELYGMDPDPDLEEALRKAVDLILRSQGPVGGWNYAPSAQDGDLSVSVMQIVAMRAAANAEIPVPEERIKKAITYVRQKANTAGPGYGYAGAGPGTPQTSAAGCLSLQLLGAYNDKQIDVTLDSLSKSIKADWASGGGASYLFYFHYYAIQAFWQHGGKYWNDWHPGVREMLLAKQNKDGSWDAPPGAEASLDPTTKTYSTAMATLVLNIYQHFLPAYQR